MVDDGRDSENGRTQSQQRYPLGYPKRITLDLTVDDHHALLGARYADRVPMADRLRALISLWREDPALAEAVSTRAQQLLLAGSPAPRRRRPTRQPGHSTHRARRPPDGGRSAAARHRGLQHQPTHRPGSPHGAQFC